MLAINEHQYENASAVLGAKAKRIGVSNRADAGLLPRELRQFVGLPRYRAKSVFAADQLDADLKRRLGGY